MRKTPTTECPGCGARNRTTAHRCRICTRVINGRVREPERGLAALRPDVGFGASFTASWGSTPPSDVADLDADPTDGSEEAPRLYTVELVAPRWTSAPPESGGPQWQPTRDGTDDDSFERAATIELDVPLRNGATPPPIEYDAERFDPSALDRDPDVRAW